MRFLFRYTPALAIIALFVLPAPACINDETGDDSLARKRLIGQQLANILQAIQRLENLLNRHDAKGSADCADPTLLDREIGLGERNLKNLLDESIREWAESQNIHRGPQPIASATTFSFWLFAMPILLSVCLTVANIYQNSYRPSVEQLRSELRVGLIDKAMFLVERRALFLSLPKLFFIRLGEPLIPGPMWRWCSWYGYR